MPRVSICYILENYDDIGMNYGELYAYSKNKLVMKHYLGLRYKDAFLVKRKKMTKSEYKDLKKHYGHRKIIYMDDKDKNENPLLIPVTKTEENLIHVQISHDWFEMLPKYTDVDIDIFEDSYIYKIYGYDYFNEIHKYGYIESKKLDFLRYTYNMKLPIISKIIPNIIMSKYNERE